MRFLRRSKIIIVVLYGALNHSTELYSLRQPDRRIELKSMTNKRPIEDRESWAESNLGDRVHGRRQRAVVINFFENYKDFQTKYNFPFQKYTEGTE